MASYIPASYAGRDFATRTAAHDQLWSNDDCLMDGFSTAGLSGEKLKNLFMQGRDEGTVTRKNGKEIKKKAITAMTEDEANARVQAILADRKKKKASKATPASGNSSQVLKLEKTLADADVRWKKYVNDQVKAKKDIDPQKQAEHMSYSDLLKSKIDRAKLDAVQGAGNASGKKKKKKNKRNKIALSDTDKQEFDKMVSEHADKVIDVLDQAKTRAEYTQNLKREFLDFGNAKIQFYQSLPAETEKEIKAKDKRIEHLRLMVKKQEEKTVDEKKWNATNFADFKILMNEYRTKLQEINDGSMSQIEKSHVKKFLRSKRTELVNELLNGAPYVLDSFNKKLKEQKVDGGRVAGAA